MSDKVDLRLDWCSYEAARFAVEHWHYSKCLPAGVLVSVGVWENRKYIGCIIFSHGANKNIGMPYGLSQNECVELTRVALNKHESSVSRIVAVSIKMLKKQSPLLRLIVSYADYDKGHVGGIYKAGNWVYVEYIKKDAVIIEGITLHPRSVFSKYGFRGVQQLKDAGINAISAEGLGKYKYLFPLDDAMRKQIEPLRKPYPKRGRDEAGNVSQSNEKTGGSNPTRPLLQEVENGTP